MLDNPHISRTADATVRHERPIDTSGVAPSNSKGNKAARALEGVLRMHADPIAAKLKVRAGLKAGGYNINRNRLALSVGA